MRMRILPLAGLLLLAGAPALVRAAEDKPALVVAFKSLDGLISDAKYLAELAGKEEEAKQTEKMLKGLLGDPKGLEGIDPKKPIGLYVRINEDDPTKSEGVVLVPVVDEDALITLLKKQDKLKVGAKDADGVYPVAVEGLDKVPFYFKFANKYAYITGLTKTALAKDRLIAPNKVLAGKTTSLAAIILHVDAIPQTYKDMAVTTVTESLAAEKKKTQPDETPAQKAARLAMIDQMADLVKSVVEDGGDLTASIDVDQSAGELSASASFSGKSGSKLSGTIADLGNRKSVGASLIGADSAANAIFNVALPEALRKAFSDAVDDAVKKGLADAAGQGQREAAEAVVKALLPTVKAGELDGGFDLRGPNSKGLYTLLMGLKVANGGEIEKVFRDAVKSAPEKDQKSIKLDVAKSGGVSIHQIIPDAKQADENSKRLFGDNPEVYFAFRDDALLVAGGQDGLAAIKEAVAAKPKTGATMQMEASMSRFAPLMSKENPAATEVAKKVFKDGKKDKVRLALEGGKALTIKVSMDAPVVTFSVQMAEAQQKAPTKDQDK